MMSRGKAGKMYIEEIARFLKLWIRESPLKTIAFKELHVHPYI